MHLSDPHHLLIPCAASTADGAQQTLDSLALPHLAALLARLTPDTARAHWGDENSFSSPAEMALAHSLARRQCRLQLLQPAVPLRAACAELGLAGLLMAHAQEAVA